MVTVNLITENIHYDRLIRQIPASGFEGFNFIQNSKNDCDAVVVFEYAKKDLKIKCIPENVWLWSMEPPDEEWEWLRKCYKYYSKVITIDHNLQHPKLIHHQLAIPWQINKTFDQLIKEDPLNKKYKDLSFFTSNYAARSGHKKRLLFLNNITGKIDFDLWGRGFKEVEDKSDGLLPYKYALIIENSNHKDYWSEKLADAFLCGCLPIYYGCNNINDYFLEESLIKIDITKPSQAIEIIKNTIANKEWEKRKEFILKMKEKILSKYQFFPVFLNLFKQFGKPDGERKEIFIPQLSHHPSNIQPFSLRRNFYLLKKMVFKKRYLNLDSRYFGFTTYK